MSEISRKVPRRAGNFLMNSPVINSAIGDGNIMMGNEVNWYGETNSAFLDDLRELIALLRAEIGAADGGKPADSRIQYELQTIEEELDEDEPDGETIRSRWKQVLKLLGPLQHMANVTQITTSILTLFGGN